MCLSPLGIWNSPVYSESGLRSWSCPFGFGSRCWGSQYWQYRVTAPLRRLHQASLLSLCLPSLWLLAGGRISGMRRDEGRLNEEIPSELDFKRRVGFQKIGMWGGRWRGLQRKTSMGKDTEVRKYSVCLENSKTSFSRIWGWHKRHHKSMRKILEFFEYTVCLISFEYCFVILSSLILY